MYKATVTFMLMALIAHSAIIEVSDSDINPGDDILWSFNDTIILKDKVFIDSGATLTIDSGVVVLADSGEGTDAKALIVARHGKISAQGTASHPIIFTSIEDNFQSATELDEGKWGGLVLLGNAPINGGESRYLALGDSEKALYGGDDPHDESGTLQYVVIRYAGTDAYTEEDEYGAEDDDELEFGALTLCGVGNATVIENIDVWKARDDSYKIFGGCVNMKYLVAGHSGNNNFDFSKGYCGALQYIIGFNSKTSIRRSGQMLRCENTGTNPKIANMTLVSNASDASGAAFFADSASALIFNSIFQNAGGISADGKSLSLLPNPADVANISDFEIRKCMFVKEFKPRSERDDYSNKQELRLHLQVRNGLLDSVGIWSLARNMADGTVPFDFRPDFINSKADVFADVNEIVDYFENKSFIGACDPCDTMWLRGWTTLDSYSFFYDEPQGPENFDCMAVETNLKVSAKGAKKESLKAYMHHNDLRVHFRSPSLQKIAVELYNISGMNIGTLYEANAAAGQHMIKLHSKSLSKGYYIIRLIGETFDAAAPILLQ